MDHDLWDGYVGGDPMAGRSTGIDQSIGGGIVSGEVGYRAYGDAVGWKNYLGRPMPAWDEFPEAIRNAWNLAAYATSMWRVGPVRSAARGASACVGTSACLMTLPRPTRTVGLAALMSVVPIIGRLRAMACSEMPKRTYNVEPLEAGV